MLNQSPSNISEKEKRFASYWEAKRKKGKWKFAFGTGVLAWALPVFVVLEIYRTFSQADYTFEIDRIIFSALVWSLAGFFGFGLFMWWWNEKSYRQLKAKNPES